MRTAKASCPMARQHLSCLLLVDSDLEGKAFAHVDKSTEEGAEIADAQEPGSQVEQSKASGSSDLSKEEAQLR